MTTLGIRLQLLLCGNLGQPRIRAGIDTGHDPNPVVFDVRALHGHQISFRSHIRPGKVLADALQ
ncbi:hypothetical protein D3C86_2028880 [compost metagenome]